MDWNLEPDLSGLMQAQAALHFQSFVAAYV